MKNDKNLSRNSAWLYDFDARDIVIDDIPFYIGYAGNLCANGGEILELGCGTGRVALKLAQEGFKVTGLDLSSQMLDVFRGKLDKQPELKERVAIVHGDMTAFDLRHKFALIIAPFRAFQAIVEDGGPEAALSCIRKHLAEGGVFIINVFNPYPVMDESWCYPESVQWESVDEATGNRVVKKDWGDKIDIEKQIIYPHFAYEVTYPDGKFERVVDDLRLKYYYTDQLRDIVEKSGLAIVEEFSWYDKSPLEKHWREIIFVCR